MPTPEEYYDRLKGLRRGRVKPSYYRITAEAWGYTYEGTTGSHMQFKKPGNPKLTAVIKHGQYMSRAAVNDLIRRIEKEIGEDK
jgi:predicted RNA binding protein YcfA (HicA-like mRNA interferase family)